MSLPFVTHEAGRRLAKRVGFEVRSCQSPVLSLTAGNHHEIDLVGSNSTSNRPCVVVHYIQYTFTALMTIPIVQGVAVSSAPTTSYSSYHGVSGSDPFSKSGGHPSDGEILVLEERRTRKFQDVGWAIAFYLHLAAMLVVLFAGLAARSGGDSAQGGSHASIIWLVTVCGIAGIVMASLALSFMFRNADILVKIALVFSVATSLAMGIFGFVIGSILLGVIGMLNFAIGICYARLVWNRLAFAAANLKTALSAIRANLGVLVLAYALTGVSFAWTMLWMLGLGASLEDNNAGLVFLLFLSFYWVHQVISNTVHVTTAGGK
jgi:hypothetical protein